jgi:uncharacterized membrane-anchored protein
VVLGKEDALVAYRARSSLIVGDRKMVKVQGMVLCCQALCLLEGGHPVVQGENVRLMGASWVALEPLDARNLVQGDYR